jgi:hypothetical protein
MKNKVKWTILAAWYEINGYISTQVRNNETGEVEDIMFSPGMPVPSKAIEMAEEDKRRRQETA